MAQNMKQLTPQFLEANMYFITGNFIARESQSLTKTYNLFGSQFNGKVFAGIRTIDQKNELSAGNYFKSSDVIYIFTGVFQIDKKLYAGMIIETDLDKSFQDAIQLKNLDFLGLESETFYKLPRIANTDPKYDTVLNLLRKQYQVFEQSAQEFLLNKTPQSEGNPVRRNQMRNSKLTNDSSNVAESQKQPSARPIIKEQTRTVTPASEGPKKPSRGAATVKPALKNIFEMSKPDLENHLREAEVVITGRPSKEKLQDIAITSVTLSKQELETYLNSRRVHFSKGSSIAALEQMAVAYALSNVQDDKDSTIKANAKSSADMTVWKQETTKEFQLVRKELLAIKKSSDEQALLNFKQSQESADQSRLALEAVLKLKSAIEQTNQALEAKKCNEVNVGVALPESNPVASAENEAPKRSYQPKPRKSAPKRLKKDHEDSDQFEPLQQSSAERTSGFPYYQRSIGNIYQPTSELSLQHIQYALANTVRTEFQHLLGMAPPSSRSFCEAPIQRPTFAGPASRAFAEAPVQRTFLEDPMQRSYMEATPLHSFAEAPIADPFLENPASRTFHEAPSSRQMLMDASVRRGRDVSIPQSYHSDVVTPQLSSFYRSGPAPRRFFPHGMLQNQDTLGNYYR